MKFPKRVKEEPRDLLSPFGPFSKSNSLHSEIISLDGKRRTLPGAPWKKKNVPKCLHNGIFHQSVGGRREKRKFFAPQKNWGGKGILKLFPHRGGPPKIFWPKSQIWGPTKKKFTFPPGKKGAIMGFPPKRSPKPFFQRFGPF